MKRLFLVLFVFFGSASWAEAQPGQGPVVFLHGLCSSSGTWTTTRLALQAQGWKFGGAPADPFDQAELDRYQVNADFYTLNFSDQMILNGIESWATDLRLYLRRLDQYRVQRGLASVKFTLVGHSAGGVAADYYLKNLYDGNVSHLVTYGSPHQGTNLAAFRSLASYTTAFLGAFYNKDSDCDNPFLWEQSLGVQEMVSGSRFLVDLNAKPFPAGVKVTSLIGSFGTGLVCPGSDCVVTAGSQDVSKLVKSVLASLFSSVTVPKNHVQETSDWATILWALNPLTRSVATSPSQMVGTWVNPDPKAYLDGSIVKVMIRNQAGNFFENIWSSCGLGECADGEVPAAFTSLGTLVAPLGVQTDTFSLTPTGNLSVVAHFHFADSKFPDSEVTAILVRSS